MQSSEALLEILQRSTVPTATFRLLVDTDQGPVYSLIVDGGDAVEHWRTLRALVEQTGYWPVLLGDKQSASIHVDYMTAPISAESVIEPSGGLPGFGWKALENLFYKFRALNQQHAAILDQQPEHPTASLIEAGLRLDVAAWFADRWADEFKLDPAYTEASLHADWPSDVGPLSTFSIPFDVMDNSALPEVYLALLPTLLPWQIPAILRFGNWNECPLPEEHVALMKYWHERYGAEVVGFSNDMIEMVVRRPPTNRAAALELAREQFIYCEDIVLQGGGSLEALAATLLDAPVWYFWWD